MSDSGAEVARAAAATHDGAKARERSARVGVDSADRLPIRLETLLASPALA